MQQGCVVVVLILVVESVCVHLKDAQMQTTAAAAAATVATAITC
jgi:hypothetical protein